MTGKKHINFEWKTKKERAGTGGVNFQIEHFGKETQSLHVIGRRNGKFL